VVLGGSSGAAVIGNDLKKHSLTSLFLPARAAKTRKRRDGYICLSEFFNFYYLFIYLFIYVFVLNYD